MFQRILESGHYYACKGPTAWAVAGWKILTQLKCDTDGSVLLVDDFHAIEDVNPAEVMLDSVEFSPNPDFVIKESDLRDHAKQALDMLKNLPRKSRARVSNGSGAYFCSGAPLTKPDESPTCLLYDLGFNLWKGERALSIVNILPEFYAEEQRMLIRLTAKILPHTSFLVILHDSNGQYHDLPQ